MTSSGAAVTGRSRDGEPTLDRLLQPIELTSRLALEPEAGLPTWFTDGAGWRLLASPRPARSSGGDELARFALPSGAAASAFVAPDGAVAVPFDPDEAYVNYLMEAWRHATPVRRLSTRQLQVYYRVKRLLPRGFWLAVRRRYIRGGELPAFPGWPLEEGVDRLLRFYALCLLRANGRTEASFRWFWPSEYHAALTLTHDVETEAGLRLALDLADLEQERGLRSSFNLVATHRVDDGIVRELRDRGFEIGLHGLRHDRSLFSSRDEFERQLPQLAAAADELGAVGFRSPSTHREPEWLNELPVSYDCTVPHSDPYEPQPGGCCSLWPFLLGDVVELPYTLPQDHLLFTLLGERSAATWLGQSEEIEARFGLIQCLSHPDRGYLGDPDKRAIYRDFLDGIADRRHLWKALPREIADWWRRRESGATQPPAQLLGTVRADDAGYAVFSPPGPGAATDRVGSSRSFSSQERDRLAPSFASGPRRGEPVRP